MLKRLFIPPLLPVILLAFLSIWVIFDETQSAPRMIDGSPDDAPRNAAGILMILSPILYLPFGILNLIDSAFDRFSRRSAWAATGGICMLLSALLTTVFYRPEVDPSPLPGVGIAILTGFFILMPMTFIRRLMLSPRRDVSTLMPGPPVPFE
jgi:hypothetical protein